MDFWRQDVMICHFVFTVL